MLVGREEPVPRSLVLLASPQHFSDKLLVPPDLSGGRSRMEVPPSYSRKLVLAPLTEEELNAVTVVFHQYETGLREGCIFTKVRFYQH